MKNLADLPARGEMLLDTINLWAHWSSYEWEKGMGVWWKNPPPYRKQYKKFYNDNSTEWPLLWAALHCKLLVVYNV